VAADDLWLSPAYQRDIFGVHFTWQPDATAVTAAVAQIERALRPFSPRPHWAKVFGDGFDWSALYPRLDDFRSLVERYDPNGVFRTGLVSRTILSTSF
jgi:xylitol oxidase